MSKIKTHIQETYRKSIFMWMNEFPQIINLLYVLNLQGTERRKNFGTDVGDIYCLLQSKYIADTTCYNLFRLSLSFNYFVFFGKDYLSKMRLSVIQVLLSTKYFMKCQTSQG